MKSNPLSNYLRMYRRRSGLSQDEVAFLLGTICGTSVSRHEHDDRIPMLGTALSYELIFGTPARELYPTEYKRIEKIVKTRARKLLFRLQQQPDDARRVRKILSLKTILKEGKKQAS